jgi:hypothetical protein
LIALYIILGVLLLILLILLIPIEVLAHYTDELSLTVKVLFYQKKLLPAPPKKKKPSKPKKEKKPEEKPKDEKPKKEKPKKPNLLTKTKDKKGMTGLLSLLTGAARIAGGAAKGIISHVVIRRLEIGIALNSGDAASTAVNYGKLCSVVYPAVNVITAATVCKDYNVTLEPVFDSDKPTEVYADVHAHLRPIFAVAEAVKAGVKLLWLRIRL